MLSNLETHNAQLIREGKSKEERFLALKEIAEYQIRILNEAQNISNKVEHHISAEDLMEMIKAKHEEEKRLLSLQTNEGGNKPNV